MTQFPRFAKALTLTLVLAATACTHTRPPETPSPLAHSFTAMTYNAVAYGPAVQANIDAIARADADIVMLQEVLPELEAAAHAQLATQYPHQLFHASNFGGGPAFLSRFPMEEIAFVPSPAGWFDGWNVAVETPGGEIQALNVHLRPPLNDKAKPGIKGSFGTGTERLAELQKLHAALKPGMPAIVAGDFNDDEDSKALEWLDSQGMTNALPEFDRSTDTWHWKVGFVTMYRRFDHIFYSKPLHALDARVIHDGASDHFPVVTTLSVTN